MIPVRTEKSINNTKISTAKPRVLFAETPRRNNQLAATTTKRRNPIERRKSIVSPEFPVGRRLLAEKKINSGDIPMVRPSTKAQYLRKTRIILKLKVIVPYY